MGSKNGSEQRKADWMVGKYLRETDPDGYAHQLCEAVKASTAAYTAPLTMLTLILDDIKNRGPITVVENK